jgi:hypothetical protein
VAAAAAAAVAVAVAVGGAVAVAVVVVVVVVECLYPALSLRYSALQNGTSNNVPLNSSTVTSQIL